MTTNSIQLRTQNQPVRLNPIHNFLLLVAGVDPQRLSASPKSEKIIYPALGILMCLATLWTSIGITSKLHFGLNLNPGITAIAFIFISTFALLLEMIVVGTLRQGSKFFGNLGIRILLGINLMILQVVPVLIIVFEPEINLYKNEKIAEATIQAKERATKTYDLDSLNSKQNESKSALEQAKQNKLNPPPNKKIESLESNIKQQETVILSHQKNLERARSRLNELHNELIQAKTLSTEDKESKIKLAEENIKKQRWYVSNLEDVVRKAQVSLSETQEQKDNAIAQYNDELDLALKEALQTHALSAKQVEKAKTLVENTTTNTKKLAQQTASSRFFNDAAALVDLMGNNSSVLLVSLFIVFIALLIDLMPIMTKLQLSKGVYAKLTQDDEEIIKALSDIKKSQLITKVEQHKIELERTQSNIMAERLKLQCVKAELEAKKIKLENDLQAITKFVKQDKGATNAKLIALRLRNELDDLQRKSHSVDNQIKTIS